MKLCTRCILPETFPGITFDEQGICHHCLRFRSAATTEASRVRYEQKFQGLLGIKNRQSAYDVLLAYSGGKDSTYTLDILINRYRLRVLALTFDNGFVSPRALQNIYTVCATLGADLMVVRPNPTMLQEIFRMAARRELFATKTLERASTICTACIGLVKNLVLRTAIEKEIPFVGFGWSPGQAPVHASVMQTNPSLMRQTSQALYAPLHRIVGDAINPFFCDDSHLVQADRYPCTVHPLAFLPYDEAGIVKRITSLGWIKPDDTDPNSSNCLLNAFANHVHRQRYRFHPYAWEVAGMVRQGVMTREEGLEKCEPPEIETLVEHARQILFGPCQAEDTWRGWQSDLQHQS